MKRATMPRDVSDSLVSPMFRLRLLTALVLSVLLIQASLVGYGGMCVENGGAMAQPTDTMAMAHAGDSFTDGEHASSHCTAEQPCPNPSTPNGCAARAACASPALPAIAAAAAAPPADDPLWADAATLRQGPPTAPDLPPPRA